MILWKNRHWRGSWESREYITYEKENVIERFPKPDVSEDPRKVLLLRTVNVLQFCFCASWGDHFPQFHGCWQKTAGSETKGFITHITNTQKNQHCLALVPKAPVSVDIAERVRWHLHEEWVALQKRNHELKESRSFILDSTHGHCFPWRETLFLSSEAANYTASLEK